MKVFVTLNLWKKKYIVILHPKIFLKQLLGIKLLLVDKKNIINGRPKLKLIIIYHLYSFVKIDSPDYILVHKEDSGRG